MWTFRTHATGDIARRTARWGCPQRVHKPTEHDDQPHRQRNDDTLPVFPESSFVVMPSLRQTHLRIWAAQCHAARICSLKPAQEICHFDGSARCVIALIARLGACALDGLLDRIGRDHTENGGHAGL